MTKSRWAILLAVFFCAVIGLAFWLVSPRVEPQVANPELQYFDTGFNGVRVGVKLPPAERWENTVVSRDEADNAKLPQMVRREGLKAVGRVEVHRVEIRKEDRGVPLNEKLERMFSGNLANWQEQQRNAKVRVEKRRNADGVDEEVRVVEEGLASISTGTVETTIVVDGMPQKALTLSVWAVKMSDGGKSFQQYRVTETMTVIELPDGALLLVQFVIQQEVEAKNAIVVNMADSMVKDKTGALTLRPLARVDPELEAVRDSLQIRAK